MRVTDLATNRVLLHALKLGWEPVADNKVARRHYRWEGPEELRISLYKGVKTLDYTVGIMGTTSEDHAIYLLNHAAGRVKNPHSFTPTSGNVYRCSVCEQPSYDCTGEQPEAAGTTTLDNLKGQRIRLHKGGLVAEDDTTITLFIPGVAEYIAEMWNKEADLKLINERRINPKGVRGQ